MAGWKREPLEDFEAQILRKQATSMSDEHELIIKTLLHTGMRADEFAHLRSSWLGQQQEEIRIQAVDTDSEQWSPKSEAGVRVVPLRDPDVIRQTLQTAAHDRHFANHHLATCHRSRRPDIHR